MGFLSTLPDGLLPESDVEGMRQFLARLFVPAVHPSFYVQMYIGTATAAVLALMAVLVVARRLLTRSAWLIQVHHTPRGAFYIPNAVMALIIFLFLYTLVYIAYAIVTIGFYRDGRYQNCFIFFREGPWLLLWIAAWFSCCGSVSAFPDALRQRGRKVGRLQKMLLRPAVFHGIMIAGPVLCCGTILVPMLFTIKQFNRMLPVGRAWFEQAANPQANVAELAAQAREIWLGVTLAYYYDGITFAVWVAWGVILCIVFVSIASHTLLRVRAQVKLAKKKKEALARTQPTFYLFSSRPDYGRSPVVPSNSGFTSSTPGTTTNGTRSLRFAPDEQFREQQTAIELAPELLEAMQTETNSVMFPALKIRPGEKLTRVQAASRRSTALKLVYRNLLVQYTAIALGIGSFSVIAVTDAITSYTAARANDMGKLHTAVNLIGVYNSLLFGVCILGAVAWRSLDPAFIIGADVDDEEVELSAAVSSSTPAASGEKKRSVRGAQPIAVDVNLTREALLSPLEKSPSIHSIKPDEPGSRDELLPASTQLTPPRRALDSYTTFASPTSPRRSKYGAWRDAPA